MKILASAAMATGMLTAFASAARADDLCEWYGDYYANGNFDTCQLTEVVPAGCPVHVVVRHGSPAPRATVDRGGTTVDITGTVTANDVAHDIATTDELSCDCAPATVRVEFDETTIELVGAQSGDIVSIPGGDRAISAPGPCPAVVWPSTYVERLACDLCGTPDGGGADDDDDDDSGGSHRASTGCAAGGGGTSMLAVLGALALVTGSRRRARR